MVKEKIINNFGKRLARLRKERGLTQQQLADKIDVSRRVIAYYEVESDNPPSNIVVLLSKALNVSADEILGLTPSKDNGDKPNLKLTRRMRKIEALPSSKQKILLQNIDMFLKGVEAS
jgi:transcriptional regulator with XRE-family HTH domain